MAKTYKDIKKSLPEINSEKVKDISDELDRILAIKTLFKSKGGRVLIDLLRNNCSITLRKAIVSAKNGKADILIAQILDYSSNIDLLSTVQDISIEEELRDQLDEAVKEAFEGV